MEDLFDSLIYIIIAVAGLLISALGKKKKKPAPNVVSNKPDDTKEVKKKRPLLSNLEELLNEELGLSEKPYEQDYHEEVEYKPSEPILDSPVSELDTTDDILDTVPTKSRLGKEDSADNIKLDRDSEILKNSIENDELRDDDEAINALSDFNLEDAIIYSEILNRKEY